MNIVAVIGKDVEQVQAFFDRLAQREEHELALLLEEGAIAELRWAERAERLPHTERLPSSKEAPAWFLGLVRRWYALPFRVPATLGALQRRALSDRHSPASFERLLWLIDIFTRRGSARPGLVVGANASIGRRLAVLKRLDVFSCPFDCVIQEQDLRPYADQTLKRSLQSLFDEVRTIVVLLESEHHRLVELGVSPEKIVMAEAWTV